MMYIIKSFKSTKNVKHTPLMSYGSWHKNSMQCTVLQIQECSIFLDIWQVLSMKTLKFQRKKFAVIPFLCWFVFLLMADTFYSNNITLKPSLWHISMKSLMIRFSLKRNTLWSYQNIKKPLMIPLYPPCQYRISTFFIHLIRDKKKRSHKKFHLRKMVWSRLYNWSLKNEHFTVIYDNSAVDRSKVISLEGSTILLISFFQWH